MYDGKFGGATMCLGISWFAIHQNSRGLQKEGHPQVSAKMPPQNLMDILASKYKRSDIHSRCQDSTAQ